MSLENVTAVILAGGLGTRLRSVVADKPKVLADVGGRPFLEYLFDQLAREGVRSVVLCTGYMGDQIAHRFGTAYNQMVLHYSPEPHPLGTGGALRLALPMLKSETALVLNGDSYCGARLDEFMTWHTDRQSDATILLAQIDDTRRYGRVEIDDRGRILRFSEKTDTEGPGWINAGIYLVRHHMLESIEPGRAVSIEREVFPDWMGKGLHGFPCEARLWDIGVPSAYAQANAEFVSNVRGK